MISRVHLRESEGIPAHFLSHFVSPRVRARWQIARQVVLSRSDATGAVTDGDMVQDIKILVTI